MSSGDYVFKGMGKRYLTMIQKLQETSIWRCIVLLAVDTSTQWMGLALFDDD